MVSVAKSSTIRRVVSACGAFVLAAAWPTLGHAQSCESGGVAGSRFYTAVDWVYLCQWPITISGTVLGVKYANKDYTIPGVDLTRSCNPSPVEEVITDA